MAATLVAVEMMKHCALWLWLIAIFLVIVVVLNPIYDTQAAPDCLCDCDCDVSCARRLL